MTSVRRGHTATLLPDGRVRGGRGAGTISSARSSSSTRPRTASPRAGSPRAPVLPLVLVRTMDASVFPGSVGAKPMQTLYTFAKILADRLR